ncbi:MAG: hypothetical protein M0006_05135 [Magnetospirillum sp.]|nr:hypothetical protein [Magnetospirillum sp.]
MPAPLVRTVMPIAAAIALSACSYSGGDIGNPLVRKVEWQSYVEGSDIRRTCGPGAPDRYRLVYNAIYDEQLRMYETDAVRRLLKIRVTHPGSASYLTAGDPLGPWQAAETTIQLDSSTFDRLVMALDTSGLTAPPPVGLQLPSRSYFWTAAFCKDGRYGFTAWKYPSAAFRRITFDTILFANDPTGIAVAKAGPVPYDPVWEMENRGGAELSFTLAVGENGLMH